ncbi:MAG: histidinol dehydrogenase [Archangiaceae bacterium]|nr:histidinol dehydrogenase [Archangiaceae bacterium]
MSAVKWRGALAALSPEAKASLLERSFSNDGSLAPKVTALIDEVKRDGDAALLRQVKAFDKVELTALEVPAAECARALAALDPKVRSGLERAAKNLERVARAQLPGPLEIEVEPGVVVGRRADPLARVGVYAPGGRAAYPSSVLMGVVPARAAGVREVIVCSPAGPNGRPSDVVLAAAALAQATRVFSLGGAGAIAAMAYGTRSVPRVDRIVGPGNAWVAEAKRQVASDVGIDSPAGPSELLAVADAAADAAVIAREMLAQAEHDPDACCVALVQSDALAERIDAELTRLTPSQPRREVIEAALRSRGAVLTVASLDEAWPFVEAFAAEHLLLALAQPREALPKVKNAGTVFLGEPSSVAFGDYVTGSNHVLPTAGAARRFSGLSVLDFVRWQTWQEVTRAAAANLSDEVGALATSEGLHAHAATAEHWKKAPSPLAGEGRGEGAQTPPTLRKRDTLKTLVRYVPTRPPCEIDLTDNTNLFGVPPHAHEVLKKADPAHITRYPSPYVEKLREALGRECGVPAASTVTGCGSDDLLDAACAAFAEPGEKLAYCPPTFGIVPSFGRANGLVPVATALDVEALRATRAALIYLCSPNNPTGATLPAGFVESLLKQTSAVVLLDEAYLDFGQTKSLAELAGRTERLVVIRTLSKAFGLAGLRIGYALSAPSTVLELEKTRGPYKVGGLAEAAAIAVLTQDREWVRERAAETVQLRGRFADELKKRGLTPLPSEANFVLVPVKGCEDVATRLREHKVSVRAFPGLQGVGDAVRISIGTWSMMQACLDGLDQVLR